LKHTALLNVSYCLLQLALVAGAGGINLLAAYRQIKTEQNTLRCSTCPRVYCSFNSPLKQN